MGATRHSLIEGGRAPRFALQDSRGTFFAESSEQVCRWVGAKFGKVDVDVATTTDIVEELPPTFAGQGHHMLLDLLTESIIANAGPRGCTFPGGDSGWGGDAGTGGRNKSSFGAAWPPRLWQAGVCGLRVG